MARLSETLSSRLCKNRVLFFSTGIALGPAGVTGRRRVRVGSTESRKPCGICTSSNRKQQPRAEAMASRTAKRRQWPGPSLGSNCVVLIRGAPHVRAPFPSLYNCRSCPKEWAEVSVCSPQRVCTGGDGSQTEGASRRGTRGGTEQTMEWPMHKRLRPQSVPSRSSRSFRTFKFAPRQFELERIWHYLLLWRLKPHQQPPCTR